jgi:hypothetical protein
VSFPDHESSSRYGLFHWLRWLATLIAVAFASVIVIPLLCFLPERVDTYAEHLTNWQRRGFAFVVCAIIAALVVRLLSPRWGHLQHFLARPPFWLAWLLGVVGVGAIDLTIGLSPGRSVASLGEWLGYGAGSISLSLAVLYVCPTTRPRGISDGAKNVPASSSASVMPTDWPALDAWLRTDEPAQHDFLGNHAVAKRLKAKLAERPPARSIGIIGPYGAGKSTIVNWIIELAESETSTTPPPLLFSNHSCWGFESSASALHAILTAGIETVTPFIDTSLVGSLPESYRQLFSAGGDWLDKVSRLIFRQRDPIQQFDELSRLLQIMPPQQNLWVNSGSGRSPS